MLGRKVIYMRCINCSYNNVAKVSVSLIKKHFLFIQEKFMQVRAFERYIPINMDIIPVNKPIVGYGYVSLHLLSTSMKSLGVHFLIFQ